MRVFYAPTAEHLSRLSGDWCCSYSGGKDSTALVTWVEWLRRSGWIDAPRPRLVRSDTGVEDGALVGVAAGLTGILERCGWECGLVRPEVNERLYTQILGRGVSPIHPGIRSMRWCTRSTKISPMDRWRGLRGGGLTLTGLRMGESAMRDGKLKKAGCAAGGECGIPDPGEGKYSPILHWKTCQVIDWLKGLVAAEVRATMADVFDQTARLVELYGPVTSRTLFEEAEVISSARFGCVGCPAMGVGPAAPKAIARRNGPGSPLNELYDVWHEARLRRNRCFRPGTAKSSGKDGYGPLKMEARRRLFARVVDIQTRASFVLITPEDEAFIRDCWARKVYPKGWSEADESVRPPTDFPLFIHEGAE